MARGTKIALAFLVVLFVGTGIYFAWKAPPVADPSLAAEPFAAPTVTTDPFGGNTLPETIVLGPSTPNTGLTVDVVNPSTGTEVDIFNQPAIDPAGMSAGDPTVPPVPGSVIDPVVSVTPGTGIVVPEVPAPAPAAATTYTVASGDTLGGIAKKFLGNEAAWPAIAEANPGVNPNNLKVGSTLKMPSSEQVAAAGKSTRGATRGSSSSSKKGSSNTSTRGRRYTVKSGDTLWQIAKAEYGTATKANVDRIREANAIGADGALKAGQALTIPGK